MEDPGGRQKDAVKVCVPPRVMLAEDGEMEFVAAQVTVTVALADFDGSATLAAVTEICGGEGTTTGAV
jgi:hypothetical protein